MSYENIPTWLDEKLRKEFNSPMTHHTSKGEKKKKYQEFQEALKELELDNLDREDLLELKTKLGC